MTNLKTLIKAVEENNKLNDGKWSDWDDGDHILSTYANDGYDDSEIYAIDAVEVLNLFIKHNGDFSGFGKPVYVDGEQYQVIENAYHACNPNNNDDWHAEAISLKDYRRVYVVWEQIDNETENADETCDWENPYKVTEI